MQYPVKNHSQMGMNALNSAARTASSMDRKKPERKTTVGDVAVGAAGTYALYKQGKGLAKDLLGKDAAENVLSQPGIRNNAANLPEVQTPLESVLENSNVGVEGETLGNPTTQTSWSRNNVANLPEVNGAPEVPQSVQAPTPQGGPIGPQAGGTTPPASVPLGESSTATSALEVGETVAPASEVAEGTALAEGAAEAEVMAEGATAMTEGATVAEGAVAAAETAAAAETVAAGGAVAGEVAAAGTMATEGAGMASGAAAMGPAGAAILGTIAVGTLLFA